MKILPKCLTIDAIGLALAVLKILKELSHIPAAYKYFPSKLTANKLEFNLMLGWNGPVIFLRFLKVNNPNY